MQWWKKQESPCFSCGECQVPDLIPVEEELNQESAAAGMTLEEYIKKEYLFK